MLYSRGLSAAHAAGWVIALLAVAALPEPVRAQDATWVINPTPIPAFPTVASYNEGSNWTGGAVPSGTAFFGLSNITTIRFQEGTGLTAVGGWTFNADAANYQFRVPVFTGDFGINFIGAGIAINGGSATINNNWDVVFSNNSTAGTATIINSDNGILRFQNSSTAGDAIIILNNLGETIFRGTSKAGDSTITNNSGGAISFEDGSTADNAVITNNAGGTISFEDGSTGGNATITNHATLTFVGGSTGGNAAIAATVNGIVDFSGATGPTVDGRVSAGSIAGAGTFALGSNQLTVGSNNADTQLTGVVVDGGAQGGTGASLVKTGTGTLILSGANTYTGPTTVAAGTLVVNGSIVSATTVNGGTLMGTGQLGAVTVNNGGVYAPGNSIGTQFVNGPFTLNPGAIFEVEVNAAGQSDRVVVTGTVNLTNSVLRVLAAPGKYKLKTDYLIVDNDDTDAVVGTFREVTTNFAFLTPHVNYRAGTGNDVVLTLLRTAAGGGGFCSAAVTRNQCSVAGALDQFPTDDPLFLAVLFQTVDGARQAFDALSGEIHATLPGILADDSRYVREAVLGRLMQASYMNSTGQLASLDAGGPQAMMLAPDSEAMRLGSDKSLAMPPADPGLAFWTRAYGAWGDFDGNANAASAERDLGGFVSGLDAQVSDTWRIGLAAGGSWSNVSVDQRRSAAEVESFHLAAYAGGMAGPLALRAGDAWSWQDIETNRAVVFPGFFERQESSYDADTGQLFGEIAYPVTSGGIAFEPFAGLAYVSVDTERFREHGGALSALTGRSGDQDVGYSSLGLRAATALHWGGTLIVPKISAAWQHAFDDVTPGAALAFASTGIGFGITGVPLAEDSLLVEAGLDLALSPTATLGVSYSGQHATEVSDNAVKGRLTWLF